MKKINYNIKPFWLRYVLLFLLLVALEFLVDGKSELFVHDVVLTLLVMLFFMIMTSFGFRKRE